MSAEHPLVSTTTLGTLGTTLSVVPPFTFCTRVPLPNAQAATTAAQVLRVDAPLAHTSRTFEEEHHVLVIRIQSPALRSLRTAVHATLEQLTLVLRTMEAFAV